MRASAVRTILRPACVLFLAPCLLFLGCAGVVPLPARTRGPSGSAVKQKVSFDFLVPGQTTRKDVLANLEWVDAGVFSDRFFLARWGSSNLGSFYAVCGYTSCIDAGGERLWKITNALVEFDEQGVVKRYSVFGDSSLTTKLLPAAADEKSVDFAISQEIAADHIWRSQFHPATLILSADTFEVRESGKNSHNFKVARANIGQIGHQRVLGDSDIKATYEVIHFREQTKIGKEMSVRMGVPGLMLLLEFLAQNKSR